jgi:hypothetical protein
MGMISVSSDVEDFLRRKHARTHLPVNVLVHEYVSRDRNFVEFSKARRNQPSSNRPASAGSILGDNDPVGEFLRDELIRTGKSYVQLLREYVMDRPEYKARYRRNNPRY